MSFFKKLIKKIELDEAEKTDPWSNEDIRPVPLERQTWRTLALSIPNAPRAALLTDRTGPLQYIELWFLVNMNLSTFETGASLLSGGLTLTQAILVIVFGNLIASGFAVLNSVSGADSHLGYPIVSRSVWGKYFTPTGPFHRS
jgi:NCS1 family nucleobase:cation symporter-1